MLHCFHLFVMVVRWFLCTIQLSPFREFWVLLFIGQVLRDTDDYDSSL